MSRLTKFIQTSANIDKLISSTRSRFANIYKVGDDAVIFVWPEMLSDQMNELMFTDCFTSASIHMMKLRKPDLKFHASRNIGKFFQDVDTITQSFTNLAKDPSSHTDSWSFVFESSLMITHVPGKLTMKYDDRVVTYKILSSEELANFEK